MPLLVGALLRMRSSLKCDIYIAYLFTWNLVRAEDNNYQTMVQ
jgi:hypothetical protein